ncbi:MAG: hypothetical protein GY914_07905 [Prochlorococcus sp.]|nr:hypothetical protein [Prochlorococcus sp.]
MERHRWGIRLRERLPVRAIKPKVSRDDGRASIARTTMQARAINSGGRWGRLR